MSRIAFVMAATFLSVGAFASLALAQAVPAYVTVAVEDANRPAEHRELDAVRNPAEVVAFSGMEPDDTVVDYRPGGGYYTRIFSIVVGPNGKVYASESAERMEGRPDRTAAVDAIAADPAYPNVTVVAPPFEAVDQIGEQVDIVWTSNNYHDMFNATTLEEMRAFNEGVFRALKPGGIYFVLDHAAEPDTGYSQTDTLHRIDAEILKEDIAAVGFVLEDESDVLARPDDDRSTHSSYETAQLILKFRKPE